MTKTKTERRQTPVDESVDPEVLAFRQQFDDRSPLDELVRKVPEGCFKKRSTRKSMISLSSIAIAAMRTGRMVVKNGSLPAREILTGAGPIEVSQGRVRDNSPNPDDRVQFTPSVLPAYLRRRLMPSRN